MEENEINTEYVGEMSVETWSDYDHSEEIGRFSEFFNNSGLDTYYIMLFN